MIEKEVNLWHFIIILRLSLDSLDSRSSEKFGGAMANPEKEAMRKISYT